MNIGRRLFLLNTDFYLSANAKDPIKKKTGIFYIYDDKVYNGKYYRITNRKRKVGMFPPVENSIGYVSVFDVD